MIGVFASFTTGDDIVVKSIAFALAFGVMVDAFLVRMTLVPVILADRASPEHRADGELRWRHQRRRRRSLRPGIAASSERPAARRPEGAMSTAAIPVRGPR